MPLNKNHKPNSHDDVYVVLYHNLDYRLSPQAVLTFRVHFLDLSQRDEFRYYFLIEEMIQSFTI